MIQDLVSKPYVLDLLGKVQRELEKGKGFESFPHPEELKAMEGADAADAMPQIKTCLARESPPQAEPGFEVMTASSDKAADEDELFYMPSDPVVSITQSCAEYVADQRRKENTGAERGLEDSIGFEAFDQFGQTDIGWISSLVAMGLRQARTLHPGGERAPAPPRKIDNRCRIVMMGDWGSGIKRARKISSIAREIVKQGDESGLQQHVLHLGDVYYSGFGWEYKKRFLPYWPVEVAESNRISSYSLNANHDMYAGGYGYFDVLMEDARFKPWHQGSSKFGLFNDHWRFLGLDTAYEEHGLYGEQADWIRREGEEAKANDQKMMLFSHHQPFSIYDQPGDENPLRKNILPIARDGLIHSWFWGHEHRCVAYEPFERIQYGRCAGHSGVPVYMWGQKQATDASQPKVRYEYRDILSKLLGLEKFSVFGLVVLELDGASIEAKYINEHGAEHYTETIS
jgi:hypothetical protein